MIWNLHSHSKHSHKDALPEVEAMVETIAGYGQPALGLTDHGNMAGSVQLYTECMKRGIKPFPGSELYVVHDRADKKAKRHHMCVVAFTTEGYKNLVKLSTLSHQNFYNKPIVDHADIAAMAEAGLLKGIAATSGCYFGFISQAITTGDIAQAEHLMGAYAKWFDRFYVELQNHHIEHFPDGAVRDPFDPAYVEPQWNDDKLADALWGMADDLGLPVVLTQDSHYCHQEDKDLHDQMKRLVSFGPDPDDALFPGDGFGLADEQWLKDHHYEARFQAGAEGLQDLLDAHDLSIPQLDNYHYNIPFTVADPDQDMTRRALHQLRDFGLADTARYWDRAMDEIETIKATGMAGYLMMVAEVTDWCRENRVFYQARGSASGSIVCWLLGITQLDPIKWDLSFERFISRDRTKPPDIDLDVEQHRRQDLIAWLRDRFHVTSIGTWTKYSLHGEEDDEGGMESSGSLRVAYYATRTRQGDPVGSWSEIPEADRLALEALSDLEPYSAYGTHAAGLVVTTTLEEITELVPLMKVASSGNLVTQYVGDDVEALGLVKLDVLGLKTLSVLHKAMENLGRDVADGLDWIPLNDSKTYSLVSRGDTDGVFQLEGWSARRGCKDLRPTKIGDIIAAMALFRPATMNSGATDDYIQRKHKKQDVPARNEIVDTNTKSTYGVLLFQEQVISVLRSVGLTADDLTKFLKAVKASNANIGDAGKVIDSYREKIWGLCVDAGFRKRDWDWFWECSTGFAAYGFNKAHSSAYGITAYRCAYLATHHPLEFYAAVLAYAKTDKAKGERKTQEERYLAAVRGKDIVIRRAGVNASGVSYEVDPNRRSIRKGLVAIKGIGLKTAAKIVAVRPEGGFTSLEEFCRLTRVAGSGPFLEEGKLDVGIFGKLWEAGAFDELTDKMQRMGLEVPDDHRTRRRD